MSHREQTVTVPGITAPGAVEASFIAAPPLFHLWTLTAGAGGTVNPSGEVQVEDQGTLTFTVAADAGFVIDRILVNGEDVAAHV